MDSKGRDLTQGHVNAALQRQHFPNTRGSYDSNNNWDFPNVLCRVPSLLGYLGNASSLRLVSRLCRDAHDANCTQVIIKCRELYRLSGGTKAAGLVASAAFHDRTARGCRPSSLRVELCSQQSEELLASVLPHPLLAYVTSLQLRIPALTAQHLLALSRTQQPPPSSPPPPSGRTSSASPPADLDSSTERTAPSEPEAASESRLLRALGSRLRRLSLDWELLPAPVWLDTHRGTWPPGAASGAASLSGLAADLPAWCPELRELYLRLRLPQKDEDAARREHHLDGSSGTGRTGLTATAAAAAMGGAAAASEIARIMIGSGLSGLQALTTLELCLPASALLPDLPNALQALSALSHLTKLVFPISAALEFSEDGDGGGGGGGIGNGGAPNPPPSPAPQPLPAVFPRSLHVAYGTAVRALLFRGPSPTPPSHLAVSLVELDLGHDLALTLPYLPYSATALTRLCVGELSSEVVSSSQWDVLPEPPPPLPLDLVEGLPGELWVRVDGGGNGGGDGGGGARPRCSLPGSAVRLPPRLRALKVRFMPDVAILAALAALPNFTSLECTAVRHPQGEICLDLASVGLPGPPTLGGGGGGGGGGGAGGAVAVRVQAAWLAGAVDKAAGLLLRVLPEDVWRRHPLTLRPSPFSFLRESYSRLRWSGPHAAWMAAAAPLASRVTRVVLKQMELQRGDVVSLAGALTGLQSLELVRCSRRRSDMRCWRRTLGCGVLLTEQGDGVDGGPGAPDDYEDMFGSSSSASSSISTTSGALNA